MAASDSSFDSYGFLETASLDEASDFRCHNYNINRLEPRAEVVAEWKDVVANWEHVRLIQPNRIAKLLKLGVPNEMRSQIWSLMLSVDETKKRLGITYATELATVQALVAARRARQDEMVERRRAWAQARESEGVDSEASEEAPSSTLTEDGELPSVKAVNQIGLDMDRTFYTHKTFVEKGGPGQQSLFNIMAMYAKFNPHTGYCQGMAYLGAVLLMSMDEESAFWAFTALMDGPQYYHGYFAEDLWRVQHDSQVFSCLLAQRHSDLFEHLASMDIHPLMYVTQWFMCCFTALPLWDTTLAVWDLFFWTNRRCLFRVAMAIMAVARADLLEITNLGDVLPYLQHLPADKLCTEAFVPQLWAVDPDELDEQIRVAEEALQANRLPEDLVPPRTAKKKMPLATLSDNEPAPRSVKRTRGETGGTSMLKRVFNTLATPLRTRAQGSAIKSKPSMMVLATPRAPRLETLQESLSPSFGRSGLLSPSFRGNASALLSPCALTQLGDILPSLAPLASPALLTGCSPNQLESFDMFKMRTPLRPSQALPTTGLKSLRRPAIAPIPEISPAPADLVEMQSMQRRRRE